MNYNIRMIASIGLLAVFTAAGPSSAEPPAPALRCYVQLTCHGNTAVTGQPRSYSRLNDQFYAVGPGSPMPKLAALRESSEARFLAFEKTCNVLRYARTNLPSDLGAAWNADTRDMYTEVAAICLPASSCSGAGEACGQDADCCTVGGRGMRCDATRGACVQSGIATPTLED